MKSQKQTKKAEGTSKSIKTKLMLIFTAVILILNLILSLLSVSVVKQDLIQGTHSDLIEIAKEEAKYTKAVRDVELEYIDTLAQNPILQSASTPMADKIKFCETEAKRAGYYQFAIVDKAGNATDLDLDGGTVNIADQDYFKSAMDGKIAASDLTVTDAGEQVIVFAAPIYQNGNLAGALIGRKDGQMLSDMVSNISYKKTGFAYMVNNDGTAIGDRNTDLVVGKVNYIELAKTDTKLEALAVLMKEKMLKREVGSGEYAYEGNDQIIAFAPVEGSPWIVAVGVITSEVLEEADSLRNILITLCFASVLIGVVIINIVSSKIARPIKKLALAADKLAIGDVDVNISDITASKDEIGILAVAFEKMVENIKGQAEAAQKIAAGDLSFGLEPRSHNDVLGISLVAVIENLKSLIGETETMVQAALEGILNSRGNGDKFQGGYRDIIEGFNGTLNAIIEPLNLSSDYMERISKGDIPEKITEDYQGDFNHIKTSLNNCIDAVGMLVKDTKMLSEAAKAGDFLTRAEEEGHQGDFRTVIEGVNGTLDIVVDKATWYEAIIDAIPFPVHVMDTEMKWTYLNKAYERILVEQGVITNRESCYGRDCFNANSDICQTENCGIRRLVDHGIGETYFEWAGRSNKQDTAYLKDRKGNAAGFVEVITDLTQIMRVSRYTEIEVQRVGENLRLLANGDLNFDMNIAEGDQYTEEVCGQFNAIGANLSEVKTAIKILIEDAAGMTEAAVSGDLNNRADITKHGGEFAKIMEGFNRTLDAVIAPIAEASTVLNEMAKGNLKIQVEGDYLGEHAAIKNALNETIENIKSYVDEISEVLAAIGNGNLAISLQADYKGDFVEIKDSLENILTSLSQVMGNINDAAEQVASESRQVSEGSQTLSQGSTEQAGSIQELTASIAEIASQTKKNAINANQASEYAEIARDNAEKGNLQMTEMLSSMDDISDSSSNISKIIKVIDDIAFQTNILALNAAVEAARAGQHGKGFAVVAEEVRNLAARSADAAKETTSLIEGSIDKVQHGTKIANETALALREIVDGVERAASLIVDIAQASNEQATGISQVNKGIEQVAQVTQNNSATAEESAAASEQLSSQAELLKEMVGRFKLSTGAESLMGEGRKLLGRPDSQRDGQRKQDGEIRIFLNDMDSDKY